MVNREELLNLVGYVSRLHNTTKWMRDRVISLVEKEMLNGLDKNPESGLKESIGIAQDHLEEIEKICKKIGIL